MVGANQQKSLKFYEINL